MTDPVYFVVTRRAGQEVCALYHDRLPDWITGKRAAVDGLIYALRIDVLPGPGDLAELEVAYHEMRAAGALPASNIVPAPRASSGGSTRHLGDWWTPPAPTWDPRAPGEPFPDPDSVRPKYDAPAATFPALPDTIPVFGVMPGDPDPDPAFKAWVETATSRESQEGAHEQPRPRRHETPVKNDRG